MIRMDDKDDKDKDKSKDEGGLSKEIMESFLKGRKIFLWFISLNRSFKF